VGSLVSTTPSAQALLWLLYLGLFAGGLRAIWSERRLVVLAGILAAIFLSSLGTDPDMASRAWTLATASAGLLFFGLLIGVLLRAVMSEHEVSLDTVFGASCVYLLLGMAWSMLYLIIETARVGSCRPPFGCDAGRTSGRRPPAGWCRGCSRCRRQRQRSRSARGRGRAPI
jgi:hypothetical protein